ncbi:MAG TPA: ribokinase [Propionibacteriaceae bacterium]|jgi:ribokinase
MNPPSRPRGVAVVGSINADLTAFGSPLPRPGETVTADSFSMMLGGKGANQALAASRAGVPTFMVGAVGDDLFRPLTLDALTADGVNTDAVAVLEGHTGIAHIRVDLETSQNDIAIIAEANGRITPQIAAEQLHRLAGRIGVVLLQLEIPLESVVTAAAVAHELGCQVILDPAPAQRLPEEIWASVDVVKPNETEAEVLTGIRARDEDSAVAAGRWFVDRGVGAAVITMAERGVAVVTAEGTSAYPAFAVTPVDTTAAGDAFAGFLGASLASGLGWDEAIRRSLAAGALAVTVRGASPSLPTARQVDEFLAAHPV